MSANQQNGSLAREAHERRTHVLEERKHLVVRRVVRHEEREVRVAKDSGDANEAGSSTLHGAFDSCQPDQPSWWLPDPPCQNQPENSTHGNDGDVLPGVLGRLALPVELVVQSRDGLAQRLQPGRRAIFPALHRNVERGRACEAALDVILDLGCALAEVRPVVRVVKVAELAGALGAPYDAGGRARGVEPRVRLVALVGVAELGVDLGLALCRGGTSAFGD